ncbi:acetoacetyl-CoA synthetase, partial [Trichonephila inaurata madagascariensis]
PSNTNFEHMKAITIGASPVKIGNFKYIQSILKDNVLIANVYGATEIFGPISGCDYNLPVYAPEFQVPALGMQVQCIDSKGHPVVGCDGEIVLTVPNPSLSIYLWMDENNETLKRTYLTKYPVHDVEEIQDYICVGQKKWNGDSRAVLFVKMRNVYSFTLKFKDKIANKIKKELWEDCVPELILEVRDIPYNVNNKRMESTVRDIVETNRIPITRNIRNPECLKYYCNLPEIVNYIRE